MRGQLIGQANCETPMKTCHTVADLGLCEGAGYHEYCARILTSGTDGL